jgi:hypothetical protein
VFTDLPNRSCFFHNSFSFSMIRSVYRLRSFRK